MRKPSYISNLYKEGKSKISVKSVLDLSGAVLDEKKSKPERGVYWYKSPFRDESEASLQATVLGKNVWMDHGTGEGGNVLDLKARIENWDLPSKEMTDWIKDWLRGSVVSSRVREVVEPSSVNEEKKSVLTSVKPLENRALIDYLNSREIRSSTVREYVSDVYYKLDEKNGFGIGMKNDSGGYAVRNKYMKTCVGPQDITTIRN